MSLSLNRKLKMNASANAIISKPCFFVKLIRIDQAAKSKNSPNIYTGLGKANKLEEVLPPLKKMGSTKDFMTNFNDKKSVKSGTK